jgi:hypothetical protein
MEVKIGFFVEFRNTQKAIIRMIRRYFCGFISKNLIKAVKSKELKNNFSDT